MSPQIQTTSQTNTRLAVATLIIAAAAGLAFAASLVDNGAPVCESNESGTGIILAGVEGAGSQEITNTCVGNTQVVAYTCSQGVVEDGSQIFTTETISCVDGQFCNQGECVDADNNSSCDNTDSGVVITDRAGVDITINNYCSGNTPVIVSCDQEGSVFSSAEGDVCGDGQTCQDGTCIAGDGQEGQQDGQAGIDEGCATNIDCSANLYCGNGLVCQERAGVNEACGGESSPCLTHLQCEENVCKIPGGIAGCDNGSPCATGFSCGDGGICLASVNTQCQDASDCATGVCTNQGQCVACAANADCQGNKQCTNGNCVFECQVDADCGANETCSAQNTCLVPPGAACQADSDCAAGSCVNSICKLAVGDACTADAQCVNNQCSNGSCAGPSSGSSGAGPSSGSSRSSHSGGRSSLSRTLTGQTNTASTPQCRIID